MKLMGRGADLRGGKTSIPGVVFPLFVARSTS